MPGEGQNSDILPVKPGATFGHLRDQYAERRQTGHTILKESGINPNSREGKAARRRFARELLKVGNEGEIDELTGTLNRKGFYKRLEREVEKAKKENSQLAVFFIDVNGLKQLQDNSEHKHAAGDAYLKAIADLLLENTRMYDIVGRLGGDEFAIILRDFDIKDARQYWGRLDEEFTSYRNQNMDITSLWASAGVIQMDPNNYQQSIKDADALMYQAKVKAKEIAKNNNGERKNILFFPEDTKAAA